MLTVSQRLVALFILYEVLMHSNLKVTSLYQIALNLLSRPVAFAVKEFLPTLLKSAPKISKMTPKQYVEMINGTKSKSEEVDTEPFKEAYKANTFGTPLLHLASLMSTVDDFHDFSPTVENLFIDHDEVMMQEWVPEVYRAAPSGEESYLLESVCNGYKI